MDDSLHNSIITEDLGGSSPGRKVKSKTHKIAENWHWISKDKRIRGYWYSLSNITLNEIMNSHESMQC